MWLAKLNWDESLPSNLHSQWFNYRNQLTCLNNIRIPRHSICLKPTRIQIHEFSDASKEAYGGSIYLRSEDATSLIQVTLLCAKLKVALLKTKTIPRLELCRALIATNLTAKVCKSLNSRIDNIFLWTDSTIVLNWIQGTPHTLPVFVSNRVSQIQRVSTNA